MSSIAVEEGFKVAVLLPCHNVAATIGDVVRGFAEALPEAQVYVYDNNSTDDTARQAGSAGAQVFRETRQGKGNVVRRMFASIDADIYILADGDGSYDPADAPSLINTLITEHVDMAVGARAGFESDAAHRSFTRLYRWLFGKGFTDILSGYRAFTRRFVKSFPAISPGFEIEAEMSVHASQLMIPVAEIELVSGPTGDAASGQGSFRGALVALKKLAILLKETRPFVFYSIFAVAFWVVGLVLMLPALAGYLQTGQVASLATVVIATGLLVIGAALASSGLVLDSLGRSRVEQKRVLFLTVPALGAQ